MNIKIWLKLELLLANSFILLFVLAFVGGCSSADGDMSNNYNNQNKECITDDDCINPGEICGPENRCLIQLDPLEIPMGVELYDQRTGSSSRGKLLTDFGPLDLEVAVDGKIHLVLPEPYTISGKVTTTEGIVDSTLITYRISAIPGKDVVSQTIPLGAINSDPGVDYSIQFYKHDDYFFQLIPNPVVDYASILKYFDGQGSETIDFELGKVNYKVQGNIVNDNDVPINGAQVFIFDFQTGAASTITQTTADSSGFFEVQFSNIPSTLSIFVGPSEVVSSIPSLRFDIDNSELVNGSTNHDGIMVYEAGKLHLPALPGPIMFGTTIYGRDHSGSVQAVSGASVSFTTEVGGGSEDDGVFGVKGTTDANGEVMVEVIPGNNEQGRVYEVKVATPKDSPFSSINKDIEVGFLSGFGESIELENRISFAGQVVDPSGNPLSGITVEASFSNDEELNPIENLDSIYQNSEQTDSTGWFSMLLDQGYYDFFVQFFNTGFWANSLFQQQLVSGDETANTFVFTAPDAALVKLVVEDEQGNPVPEIMLKSYQVSEECPLTGDCTYPARLLSSGKTDLNGEVILIVPIL
ncbi:MAG: carboxypeptidase-like regulatory domain-containing protein [Deltaproteobacteria bacterium]|jgi:hypothetical protein|nr:carboxypeptidase-like regulatory domain-containing protein [Deltaproteobacteria bacterium]